MEMKLNYGTNDAGCPKVASVTEKWPSRGGGRGSDNMNNQYMTKNEKETKLSTKKKSRGKERKATAKPINKQI